MTDIEHKIEKIIEWIDKSDDSEAKSILCGALSDLVIGYSEYHLTPTIQEETTFNGFKFNGIRFGEWVEVDKNNLDEVFEKIGSNLDLSEWEDITERVNIDGDVVIIEKVESDCYYFTKGLTTLEETSTKQIFI